MCLPRVEDMRIMSRTLCKRKVPKILSGFSFFYNFFSPISQKKALKFRPKKYMDKFLFFGMIPEIFVSLGFMRESEIQQEKSLFELGFLAFFFLTKPFAEISIIKKSLTP